MKIKIFLLIILIMLIPLASCSRAPELPNTDKIVTSLCAAETALPAGKIYSSDYESKNTQYLTNELISVYFGITDIQKYSDSWLSCSIFLSSGNHICEFAVIHCSSPESLIDTSRLLSSRLDTVKKNAPESLIHYAENAMVVNVKNYAVLIISSDAQNALKVLKKAC